MNCHFIHVETSKAHKAKTTSVVRPSPQLAVDDWPVSDLYVCNSSAYLYDVFPDTK